VGLVQRLVCGAGSFVGGEVASGVELKGVSERTTVFARVTAYRCDASATSFSADTNQDWTELGHRTLGHGFLAQRHGLATLKQAVRIDVAAHLFAVAAGLENPNGSGDVRQARAGLI
jgi:hypothetical protein